MMMFKCALANHNLAGGAVAHLDDVHTLDRSRETLAVEGVETFYLRGSVLDSLDARRINHLNLGLGSVGNLLVLVNNKGDDLQLVALQGVLQCGLDRQGEGVLHFFLLASGQGAQSGSLVAATDI